MTETSAGKIKKEELKKALLIETKESNIRNTKTGINAAKKETFKI